MPAARAVLSCLSFCRIPQLISGAEWPKKETSMMPWVAVLRSRWGKKSSTSRWGSEGFRKGKTNRASRRWRRTMERESDPAMGWMRGRTREELEQDWLGSDWIPVASEFGEQVGKGKVQFRLDEGN
ncbi:hypothetical protein Dda_7858 [Drechslerella dactyloides]|uniref:Uncharacterized protein n=1 Tax=Drechslerella dactyloides TaxID=74499 RepID=A0AAD6NG04_DREDA|nr:hypothetical protein Dda_7858 [Drechslerella dactyloides]